MRRQPPGLLRSLGFRHHGGAVGLGAHFDAPLVESVERRPVADRDERRLRQFAGDRAIDLRLARFVQRRGRLIEEQPVRRSEQRARDRKPLLLAARQAQLPIVRIVEPVSQSPSPAAVKASRIAASVNFAAGSG